MTTRRSARQAGKPAGKPAPIAAVHGPATKAVRKSATGRAPRTTRPSPSPSSPDAMETAEAHGGEGATYAHHHDDDDEGHLVLEEDEEEDIEDVTELLADVPRFDFYFHPQHTDEEQRTMAYRTALIFATALRPGMPVGEDEVERFTDCCPIKVEGCGGSGESDDEDEGGEAEEEGGEREEGGKAAGELPARPFQLLFPSARRVAELVAYFVHTGPFTVWAKEDTSEVLAGRYEPQVRMYWRMDLSDFIPLYC